MFMKLSELSNLELETIKGIYKNIEKIIERFDGQFKVLLDSESSHIVVTEVNNITHKFTVLEPITDPKTVKVEMKVGRRPTNGVRYEHTFDAASNADKVMGYFNVWLSTVIDRNLLLDELKNFEGVYEDELYEYLQVNDEDADTAPFEHVKQIALLDFINSAENEVKYSNDISDSKREELIEKISEFRAFITVGTKKEVTKKLSKVLATVKKASIQLFKSLWEEAKKKGVKFIVDGGFELSKSIGEGLANGGLF